MKLMVLIMQQMALMLESLGVGRVSAVHGTAVPGTSTCGTNRACLQ